MKKKAIHKHSPDLKSGIFNLLTFLLLSVLLSWRPINVEERITEKDFFPVDLLFKKGLSTNAYIDKVETPVVHTAASILQKDVRSVFDAPLKLTTNPEQATILIGTIGQSAEIDRLISSKLIDTKDLKGRWEGFLITTAVIKGKRKLVIAGSDSRGTAYGLLEISRRIGVSPWEWWADAVPEKQQSFAMPDSSIIQSPSVRYRGLFLNDEDWGLNPWSSKTFEPDSKPQVPVTGKFKGAIGPKTYARIFELLLRLRANSIWPAMHEVSIPFYFVEGNRKVAEQYGIFIGSSHCEPMARNSATEWDLAGKGEYNYVQNKENIISFWTERLKELKQSSNIFTIGMRGKHDGPMQGIRSTEEYRDAMTKVIADQTELLRKYINSDVSTIPQILIPYKEVLDVYNAGLKVPDYVTLMWCDDNYGYITHFPDQKEQQRSGGNGVYYHASYWGRPHDYLWLGTASPALLYHQMKLAYEKNVRKIWILNVGDIKPLEYQTELFMDMAWNINKVSDQGINKHLYNWLAREFKKEPADALLGVMNEHYRLAYIRKPEFMGNTREEEKNPMYKMIKDLPWTDKEIKTRLAVYDSLSLLAERISKNIPAFKRDAFFELIQYPVQGAAQLNRKLLYAQLARRNKADWSQSDAAYDSIVTLTAKFNLLNNGKWNRMMDHKPRNLPVFQKVSRTTAVTSPLAETEPFIRFSGTEFSSSSGIPPEGLENLGYHHKAVSIGVGLSLGYRIESLQTDSITVEIRLLPNHPVTGYSLRFEISIDTTPPQTISYRTIGRSEEWKENVLRNQAIRKITLAVPAGTKDHTIIIRALDEGVVLDELLMFNAGSGR